ncbi:hypothetical protein HY732_00910 [Candidatus Uhrbacteria bacterium]|nr:hypothetical protein [Candidatus Uhrbacteria bacterium]
MIDTAKRARRLIRSIILQRRNVAAIFLCVYFLIALVLNLSYTGDQSFVDLARSFLAGRLDLVSGSTYDTAPWNGKYYWPFGPLPAVLLMPGVFVFSLFGGVFYQGYLQFFLGASIAFLCFRIMRVLDFDARDAWYGVLAFCCASVFLGVFFIPNYSFFAHVVTVFFLFLAIHEFMGKKRYGLMGLFVGLAMAARPTAVFGVLFFLGDIIFSRMPLREKVASLRGLLLPMVGMGILLGWYNYARFGTPFETGYLLQTLAIPELIIARAQGLFNIAHIPGNIYYSLLALPSLVFSDGAWAVPFFRSDPWGMSMFLTSPYLLLLFFFKYKSIQTKLLIFSIGITALPLFLYYGIGYWQFGYRYALDFFPFLFLLFFKEYKERNKHISPRLRTIIMVSSCANLYLFVSLLSYHP